MEVNIKPVSAVELEESTCSDDGLSITPTFYGNGIEPATVSIVTVMREGGEVLYRGLLRVSGKGKPLLVDRTCAVKPVADTGER